MFWLLTIWPEPKNRNLKLSEWQIAWARIATWLILPVVISQFPGGSIFILIISRSAELDHEELGLVLCKKHDASFHFQAKSPCFISFASSTIIFCRTSSSARRPRASWVFVVAWHGVALTPSNVGNEDLCHCLASGWWYFRAEHGDANEFTGNPPIAQDPVVCPKTSWHSRMQYSTHTSLCGSLHSVPCLMEWPLPTIGQRGVVYAPTTFDDSPQGLCQSYYHQSHQQHRTAG